MMESQNDNECKHYAGSFLVNKLQRSLGPAGGQEHQGASDIPLLGTFVGEGAFGQVFVNDEDCLAYKISKSSSDIDKQRFEKEVERLKTIGQWHDIPDVDKQRLEKEVERLKSIGQRRDIPKVKLPDESMPQGINIIAMKTLPVLGVRCDLQQYLQFYKNNKQYKNSQIFRVLILMFMSHMSDLISQVADAMQFAHDRSIFHGDLKSENILLSISHEGGLQAMVCDWGSGNDKTAGYFFESSVTCDDILKAQDVYAFIRTLKVDCFIQIYKLLKDSIRKALPSSFLLKNLLEIDDVEKMVELAFHNGIPSKLGTFNDLIQLISTLNSINSKEISPTLGRIEELLTTQLQMLDSKVVRKEWLSLAEYYWRIKVDLDPKYFDSAVSDLNEWLVKSNKNDYVNGINNSITVYKDQFNYSHFCCFRGRVGRERADQLQQDIADLKTVPGVKQAVEQTCRSYKGLWPGSLKHMLTKSERTIESAVSATPAP